MPAVPTISDCGGHHMTSNLDTQVGTVAWFDLTVTDAEAIRDFDSAVVGWNPEPVVMDGYSDFSVLPDASTTPFVGICHARGFIADLPPQWLAYVIVENLDQSLARRVDLGGSIVAGPKGEMDEGRFCVIRDPAGAVLALLEPA
jgi:uncharacterized protein